jgi:hypothetical protein
MIHAALYPSESVSETKLYAGYVQTERGAKVVSTELICRARVPQDRHPHSITRRRPLSYTYSRFLYE